jgi:Cu-Zn family superoxide dismutase
MNVSARLVSVFAPLSLVAGCGGSASPPEAATTSTARSSADAKAAAPAASATQAAGTTVVAPLSAKSGSRLSGKATFTEVGDGVKVTIQVAGAPPGKVATHVHETGDCSSPDAKSAGGHFNPQKHQHGLPASGERHLGDLGNIDVGPDGNGTLEISVKGANLKQGDTNSYLGRAVIVHEKVDDGGQPAGNAGNRIGCGVIAAVSR